MKKKSLKIAYAAATDMGQVRKNNEDAFLAIPALGIFAVADGMGGHASGEVASQLALSSLKEAIEQAGEQKDSFLEEDQTAVLSLPAKLLTHGIRLANQEIYQSSQQNSQYKGMGTTLVVVYFSDSSAVVAHVGDSRLYRLRDKRIEQITEDHSLVWEEYKKGLISKEALSSSPQKNIVTRALGVHPTVDVDVQKLEIQAKDSLLLCSDGLSDLVQDEEILQSVHESAGNLAHTCRELVQLANLRGGKDNITILLIHISQV
jgi:serine/threonine protein phosphatase PrpC